jgi:hypothetical protein
MNDKMIEQRKMQVDEDRPYTDVLDVLVDSDLSNVEVRKKKSSFALSTPFL